MILGGCSFMNINEYKWTNQQQADLQFFIWWSSSNIQNGNLQEQYVLWIKQYLKTHPEINGSVLENMLKGLASIGMTEEEVFAMVKPLEVIEGDDASSKTFIYSEKNRFFHSADRLIFGDSIGGTEVRYSIHFKDGKIDNIATFIPESEW